MATQTSAQKVEPLFATNAGKNGGLNNKIGVKVKAVQTPHTQSKILQIALI